jgi:copper homeostasis protein
MRPLVEVCCGSVPSALSAQEGGADRVELCDNLYEGGTTPSKGTIESTRELLDIDVNVLIRPRGSDFLYSDLEMEIIRRDIALCKELGVDGVVVGFLTKDGHIDTVKTSEIIELARPLTVTFHRAFDMCINPFHALKVLISLKVDRILTSGQKNIAPEGVELIKKLVEKAEDNVIIMPGAGLGIDNIAEFHSKVQAKEYHSTLWGSVESEMLYRKENVYMGGMKEIPEFSWKQTQADIVRRFIGQLESS